MRPYMLWLTRVYAGRTAHHKVMGIVWANVLSDWARRLREHEYRGEPEIRIAPHSKKRAPSPARRTSMSIGSRLRVASQREALRLSRAAGQGGR